MDEFGEELENGRVRHKIPAPELAALRGAIQAARTATQSGAPNSAQMVTDLKERCIHCHTLQKGPAPETLFNLAP